MSLGQIAYEAYGTAVRWKVYGGGPMPRWADQSDRLKDAWEAAGAAVHDHLANKAD